MLQAVLLFILGLLLLIKGADWFVDASTGIAQKFNVPELLIGATIVSVGTTLPELMVSATSALSGHGDIAYGNAIGSIICNTALIAALTIAVRPSKVNRKALKTPVIFFFAAAAIYCFTAYFIGTYTRLVGIILLAVYMIYIVSSTIQAVSEDHKTDAKSIAPDSPGAMPSWKLALLMIIGAVCIFFGANLLVDNGTIIAKELGVPESVIALTFVALGTSLPELVTAIASLLKGHGSLSLGNIIGANLFNLVMVSGMSITLNPFNIPESKTIAGMNSSLIVDIPLMLLVMLILTVPALIREKLSRAQGIILLCIYIGFVAFQFAS